jgi:hypothetical protein
MTIYEKLANIQTNFKSKKSRFNAFGKYNFRSAEDILEATKPYLLSLGCTVTINEELISFNPPILKSIARIQDFETLDPGDVDIEPDFIEAVAIVGVDMEQKGMQTPQKYGSASSYGKKYALGNLFLIDDTQDSDATNDHGKGPVSKTQTKKPVLEGDALTKAKAAIKEGKFTIEDVQKKYDIPAATLKTL